MKQSTSYVTFFVFFIPGAQANAGEGVRLEGYPGEKIDVASIRSIQECIALAANPDVVSDMEDLATIWCKQIEQVSFTSSETNTV